MNRKLSTRMQLEEKRRVAQKTRRALSLDLTCLIIPLIVLISGVGQTFWPAWMVDYRTALVAFLLVLVIFFALMAPVIIEFSSDPRPLSGPGRNRTLP